MVVLFAESESPSQVGVIGSDVGAGLVEATVLIAVFHECFGGLRLRAKRGGLRDVYPPATALKSCWRKFHFVRCFSMVLGVTL